VYHLIFETQQLFAWSEDPVMPKTITKNIRHFNWIRCLPSI